MLRSVALAVLLVGCSKSAGNQETGAAPVGGAAKKIAVPTDEGMPPGSGGIAAMGGAKDGSNGPASVQMKSGADERFRLKPSEGKLAIELPADLKPGTEASAKLTVTPAEGFKVNAEYPTKLSLQAPAGVTLAKSEFSGGGADKAKGDADQLDEKGLVITVKLTATAAGSYTVNGTFKFAVCDHDQCLAKKETIALQIAAK
ncbi:MAG: hypothetical protein NT062_08375 [Proteobacteria bacterium]|nr:hypothetical protein [Pseudomonadota bacterium]